MIRIRVNTKHENVVSITKGRVEFGGSEEDITQEIYTILKEFEKHHPEALMMAVTKSICNCECEGRTNEWTHQKQRQRKQKLKKGSTSK